MSEGQVQAEKLCPLEKQWKQKVRPDTSKESTNLKKRNYPQVHAVVAADNISQQSVSKRTKLLKSVVKLATKQHAVGTKEIKTIRQARSNIKTEKKSTKVRNNPHSG